MSVELDRLLEVLRDFLEVSRRRGRGPLEQVYNIDLEDEDPAPLDEALRDWMAADCPAPSRPTVRAAVERIAEVPDDVWAAAEDGAGSPGMRRVARAARNLSRAWWVERPLEAGTLEAGEGGGAEGQEGPADVERG